MRNVCYLTGCRELLLSENGRAREEKYIFRETCKSLKKETTCSRKDSNHYLIHLPSIKILELIPIKRKDDGYSVCRYSVSALTSSTSTWYNFYSRYIATSCHASWALGKVSSIYASFQVFLCKETSMDLPHQLFSNFAEKQPAKKEYVHADRFDDRFHNIRHNHSSVWDAEISAKVSDGPNLVVLIVDLLLMRLQSSPVDWMAAHTHATNSDLSGPPPPHITQRRLQMKTNKALHPALLF